MNSQVTYGNHQSKHATFSVPGKAHPKVSAQGPYVRLEDNGLVDGLLERGANVLHADHEHGEWNVFAQPKRGSDGHESGARNDQYANGNE